VCNQVCYVSVVKAALARHWVRDML